MLHGPHMFAAIRSNESTTIKPLLMKCIFLPLWHILQALDQVTANHGDVLVPVEAWEGIHVPSFSVRGSRWCWWCRRLASWAVA